MTTFAEPNTTIIYQIDMNVLNFESLHKPSFLVEPTTFMKLAQQNNLLLSQLNAGVDELI